MCTEQYFSWDEKFNMPKNTNLSICAWNNFFQLRALPEVNLKRLQKVKFKTTCLSIECSVI